MSVTFIATSSDSPFITTLPYKIPHISLSATMIERVLSYNRTPDVYDQFTYTLNKCTDYQLRTISLDSGALLSAYYTTTSPYISVTQLGFASYLSAGTSTITTTVSSASASANIMVSNCIDPKTYTQFVSGSLIEHITTTFQTLISGKSPGDTTQKILSASNAAWNGNIWTGSLDLSPIPIPLNTNQGALITPLHLATASHMGSSPGYTYYFLKRDGSGVISRTVVSVTDITYKVNIYQNGYTDIRIVKLNAPITLSGDNVSFCKMLPLNINTKFTKSPSQYCLRPSLPVIKCGRNNGFTLGISLANGVIYNSSYSAGGRVSLTSDWVGSWFQEWHGGDSGSFCGTIINNQLINLGSAWFGPSNFDDGISNLTESYSAINTLTTADGYPLTPVDLSMFNTYL